MRTHVIGTVSTAKGHHITIINFLSLSFSRLLVILALEETCETLADPTEEAWPLFIFLEAPGCWLVIRLLWLLLVFALFPARLTQVLL